MAKSLTPNTVALPHACGRGAGGGGARKVRRAIQTLDGISMPARAAHVMTFTPSLSRGRERVARCAG